MLPLKVNIAVSIHKMVLVGPSRVSILNKMGVQVLRGPSAARSDGVIGVSIICWHSKYSHQAPVYSPGNG